ncbi:hypothetical protein EFO70_12000, partial [Lacticaseibacillus rhamnosus]
PVKWEKLGTVKARYGGLFVCRKSRENEFMCSGLKKKSKKLVIAHDCTHIAESTMVQAIRLTQ